MDAAVLLLALAGHAVVWIGLVNRVHAIGLSRGLVRAMAVLGLLGLAAPPAGVLAWSIAQGQLFPGPGGWTGLPRPALAYLALCWIVFPPSAAWWAWCRVRDASPEALRWYRRRTVRLVPPRRAAPPGDDHLHHFLAHLPGNEILDLDFAQRAVEVSRLDPALDGMTLVHLSDCHFTGRVGKAFFGEVVRLACEQRPDLIAVTGDLVDTEACIDWIPDTLGRLRAPGGVYFVLGNHDLRVDVRRLRRVLVESGLIDLGGRWVRAEVRGQPIIVAGNELPWIAPAADLRAAPPRGAGGGPLRILLSHSPDQLDWARAHDVDLMLAGHLHGGQIRLPLVGPILSPSHRGVRYSSGVFYREPTLLHVSRGLSGELPVRLNCPPELTQLVLHAPARTQNTNPPLSRLRERGPG